MKRLIKKAEAISLYHFTTFKSLDSIMNSGIAAGSDSTAWTNTNKSQTFFSNDKGQIHTYSSKKWQNDGAQEDNYWIMLEVNLDTRMLLPDNDDCPDCGTWEDSLDQIGQVAVDGSIPAYQIQRIHFYYPLTGAEFYDCSPSDYTGNKEAIMQEMSGILNKSFHKDMYNSTKRRLRNSHIGEIIDEFSVVIDYIVAVKDSYETLIKNINIDKDFEKNYKIYSIYCRDDIKKIKMYVETLNASVTKIKTKTGEDLGQVEFISNNYSLNQDQNIDQELAQNIPQNYEISVVGVKFRDIQALSSDDYEHLNEVKNIDLDL